MGIFLSDFAFEKVMRIHFVRHGEADYSLEKMPGEFPGVPLTSFGKEQARQLVGSISSVVYDNIFCSDMLRTRQTIAPSLPRLNKEPSYDSRLREISDSVVNNHEDNWFSETKEQQIERLESFFETLKQMDGEILIVAHFGVIKYLSSRLGNEVDSPECAGVYVVDG